MTKTIYNLRDWVKGFLLGLCSFTVVYLVVLVHEFLTAERDVVGISVVGILQARL